MLRRVEIAAVKMTAFLMVAFPMSATEHSPPVVVTGMDSVVARSASAPYHCAIPMCPFGRARYP